MLNSGRRGRRAPDSYGILSVNEKFNQANYPIPIIDSYKVTDGSYNPIDDLALDTAGGQTVVLYGSGFYAGATVVINGTAVGTVTLLDQGRLAFTSSAQTAGFYTIYVSNTDGATAIYVPGLQYAGFPTWSSPPAGSLGQLYETQNVRTVLTTSNTTFVASSANTPITYSVISGNLPPGTTLSSTGVLTGSTELTGSPTTYSFTIAADNALLETTTRAFSITVNTDSVTWSNPALNGSISTYEYTTPSTIVATDAAGYGVVYTSNTSNYTGNLALNSITGAWSGNVGAANSATAPNNVFFTLSATANTTGRYANSNVTMQIIPDVVTWSSPANNTTYSIAGGSAISSVTLSASSAAGFGVQYAANTLPTGLTLNNGVISGTPTTQQTVYTALTATANTSNRNTTQYVTWSVVVGDTYWRNTSLLLNAVTPTTTFINDASNNNSQLTIAGDTRPSNFNPYMNGYYSGLFNGSSDYITTPTSTAFGFLTGNFTVEFWVNFTATANRQDLIWWGVNSGDRGGLIWNLTAGNLTYYISPTVANAINYAWTPAPGTWYHIALSRVSGSSRLFVNGVQAGSTYTDTKSYAASTNFITIGKDHGAASSYFNGYISNLRIVKGTGVYTGNFTKPTAPLSITQDASTNIASVIAANTSFLFAKDNATNTDNSVYNLPITKSSTLITKSWHPFVVPTTVPYNTGYSTYFDGTGDYLTVASNAALAVGTGDFTVECWICPQTTTQFTALYLTSTFQFFVYNGALYWNDGTQSSGGTITLNTWQHIAVSRSGTTLRGFVNGVQVITTTSSVNLTQSTNYIGYNGGTAGQGYISNMRLVKGQALYTSNFTPSTTSLTTTSQSATAVNVSLLTCQSSTLIDNSLNSLVITSSGQAKPITVSPFTQTTSNTTVTSLGSAYFDGNDLLSIADSPVFNLSSGNWTIEGWCYLTAGSNYRTFLSKRNGTYAQWEVGIDPSNYIYFYTSTVYVSTTVIPNNVWTHFAVTYDGSNLRIFINGVVVKTQAGVTAGTGTDVVYIGGTYPAGNQYSTGYFSDVRIVKGTALYTSNFLPPQTPLTPVANTQLLTVQTNGGATNNGFVDQSSLNNLITRNGNATQGTFSPFSQTGWSYYFDGTGDELSIASNAAFNLGAGDFTIEMWVNLQSVTIQGQYFFYSDAYSPNMFLWDNGALYLRTNETYGEIVTPTVAGLVVNRWSHVACVRSGNLYSVYIDGTLLVSGTSTGVTNASSSFWFGKNLKGYISNLRVVKGTAIVPPAGGPTGPLTAVTNTSLLTCQSNRIIDNSPNNFTISKAGDVSVQAYSPFGGVTSVPTSYSNYFDGTGDYLSAPANAGFQLTGDFTVEAWIYMNTINSYNMVFGADNGTNSDYFGIRPTTIELAISNAAYPAWSYTFATGVWYHVAVTRSSNALKAFVNGTQLTLSSGSATNSSQYFQSSVAMLVGRYGGGTPYYFTGYISNARIVKGQALYTSDFTPSTTPLTTTSQGATSANVSLLTCQSATMIDNSPNYFTLTASGDVKPRPFNPFGTTTTTAVAYSPSVNGGSMYFDGSGDYLLSPALGSFSTNNFTFEGWIYPTSVANGMPFGNRVGSGAGAYNAVTLLFSSGSLLLYSSSNNSSWDKVDGSSVGTFVVNQWHHFAIVRNGNSLYAYLNGVQTFTVSITGTTYSGTYSAVYVGGNGGDNFTGYVSDVRVTNGIALYTSNFAPPTAPLTPAGTIGANTYTSALCLTGTSGGIVDAHGSNNFETVGNVQLASEDPYQGTYYSNYFDGTGDYLEVPHNTNQWIGASTNFTIECWIYLPSTQSGEHVILAKGYQGSPAYGEFILTTGTSATQTLQFLASTDGGSFGINILDSTALVPGVWTHVAAVRNGSTISLYKNGVSVGTPATSSSALYNHTGTVRIGSHSSGSGFIGYISDVRITIGTALYTSNFTPSTTPLTAVENTVLLTCQSNKFIDNSTNAFTITKAGDTTVKSFNPFRNNPGKSLYFDGSGDYMSSVSTLALAGAFTAECWFNNASTSGAQQTLFSFNSASGNGYGSLRADCDQGNVQYNISINLSTSGSGWASTISINNAYVKGMWNHLAVTRDSSNVVRVYLNGLQIGTNTTVAGALYSTSTTHAIGCNNLPGSATNPFNGYIKDLRLTNGVARYTSNNQVDLTTTPQVK